MNSNHLRQPNRQKPNKEELMDTPLISDLTFELLPVLLQEGCKLFQNKRERDMFLLGSLSLISGSLPNVYGFYHRKKVYCHLYCMVVAPPASGKGVLTESLKYVVKIQDYLKDAHKINLDDFFNLKDNPDNSSLRKPKIKRLTIPANSSSAAFMTTLQNSGGQGIIFETEADTLSATLKNDWGNYSDLLRKAFHHEPITSSRVNDEMNVDIEEPKLAVLVSGTLNQLEMMKLDDPANGLKSRFLFYVFETLPVFKRDSSNNLDSYFNTFDELGSKLLHIYKFLETHEVKFSLEEEQKDLFYNYFNKKTNLVVKEYNGFMAGIIYRLGISSFRLVMIVAVLRSFEKGLL